MLSENDIKAELSYAYLHAVAARAGFSCVATDRHKDNSGVDATVSVKARLSPQSILTEFSLDFQLKSTSRALAESNGRISYALERPHYDKLRGTTSAIPKYLALLRLPEDAMSWLSVTNEQLVCQRCVHWVSLRGAAETSNETSVTVYLPTQNMLTPESLRDIALRFSLGHTIDYDV